MEELYGYAARWLLANQGLGLQIGWLSLVGGSSFPVMPKDPLYQYTDVIILLTDGLNTQNRWSSTDKFYRLTSADQMTATFNTICTNLTKLRAAQ